MDAKHESVNKLLEDINTPTEEKGEQVKVDPSPAASQEKTVEDPATETKTEPEVVVPEIDKEVLSSSADLAIGLFDVSQTNIFRFFGKRRKKKLLIKRFGDTAIDHVAKLLNEIDAMNENKVSTTVIREFTADEFGMLRIEKAAAEYLEGLPLTDAEKDMLKVPLMQIMKKRGGTIPPEIALILGCLQIAGARTAELFMM